MKYLIFSCITVLIIISFTGCKKSVDKTANDFIKEGIEEFENENYKEAIDCFTEAIEKDSNSFTAYCNEGIYIIY